MTTPTPDNGGPAFPSTKQEDNGRGYGDLHEVHYPGMSLRDYFASKAMQAFIQNLKPNPDGMGYIFPTEWRPVVSAAWNIADTMLAARNHD